MKVLFSIITCTYNAEDTLERTILSVREQSFEGAEHIIVDGSSKDGTLALVEKYNNGFSLVISEKDKGLYDAMNKGINAANGEYLIFLNAGDKFHDADTLQRVAGQLKGDEDVIYGETALVDRNGNFMRMRRLKAPEILDWRSFKEGMLVCHQAFWARRTIAVKTPYDLTYKYSADVDWCIRVMKQSRVLYNSHETLIDYLSEGMTTANRRASLKERFRIMTRHYGLLSALARHCWFVIRAIVRR